MPRRRACDCAASRTFSSTLSAGNRLDVWNVRPSPAERGGGRRAGDVGAVEAHAAFGGLHDAGDHVEERRLAGAVRPDHAQHLAGCDLELDIVEDARAADPEADVLEGEHRVVGHDRLTASEGRGRAAAA